MSFEQKAYCFRLSSQVTMTIVHFDIIVKERTYGPKRKRIVAGADGVFQAEGYLIVKGLFEPGELDDIRSTFERIGETTVAGHFEPVFDPDNPDPLKDIRASCIRIDSIKRP